MPTTTKKRLTPLFGEGEVASVDPKLERLMQICGIKALPPVHTKAVPLERIVVLDEPLVRPSPRFVNSIKLIGIRQPPSVAFLSGNGWDSEDATYVVVMGRRRVVSARRLLAKGDVRFTHIKCEVYEQNLPRLNAFLAMLENNQRAEAWRQDVVSLRQLIGEGVAMTLDDLAAYGFNRKTIKARLQIALLPSPLIDQICAGVVSQQTAMQMTRLKAAERNRLCALVQEGEELTAELVKHFFKRQVNASLATVHLNLAQAWTALSTQPGAPSPAALSGTAEITSSTAPIPMGAALSEGPVSASHLLPLLRQFEAHTRTDTTLMRAGALVQVLIQELEIAARTQQKREGESLHV